MWGLSFLPQQSRAGYPGKQPRIISWEESRVAGDDGATIQSPEVFFGSWY